MKKLSVFICLSLLTCGAFAASTTGDASAFNSIYDTVSAWLTGSLGNLILIVSLLGVIMALAGFAKMTVMFPLLVIAIIVRYGPAILSSLSNTSATVHSQPNLILSNPSSLLILVVAVLIGVVFSQAARIKKLQMPELQ
jgi:hypothetical protein